MLKFLLLLAVEVVLYVALLPWLMQQPGGPALAISASWIYVAVIIMTAFYCLWRPMMDPYPYQEPAVDAEWRNYQSYGIGIMNLTLSIHTCADEQFLHLRPLLVFRWLGGEPASIPWAKMSMAPKGRRIVVEDRFKMEAPRWVVEKVQERTASDE